MPLVVPMLVARPGMPNDILVLIDRCVLVAVLYYHYHHPMCMSTTTFAKMTDIFESWLGLDTKHRLGDQDVSSRCDTSVRFVVATVHIDALINVSVEARIVHPIRIPDDIVDITSAVMSRRPRLN